MFKKPLGIVLAAGLALSNAGCANLPANTQTFITDVENAALGVCSVLPDVAGIVALLTAGNIVVSTSATYIEGVAKSLCSVLAPPATAEKLKASPVPLPVQGTVPGTTIVIHGTYYPVASAVPAH